MHIRLYILLGLVYLVAADPTPNPPGACHLCLHGACYEKTKLLDSYSIPNILNYAVDRSQNILYYTDLRNAVFSLNLDDKTVEKIRDNHNERSLAVDQKTRDLYIAADTDIIKYNPVTNKTDVIPIGLDVRKLQFHNKLYILQRYDDLYVLEGPALARIPPINDSFVRNFAVDKHGDIYFSRLFNENFKLQGGRISKAFADRYFVYATDKHEELYFIDYGDKSILKLDYDVHQFVPVGAFDAKAFNNIVMGALFDGNDNVIFVDYDDVNTKEQELYYLTRNGHQCRVIPKIEIVKGDK